jgi:FtsZ-binding cell division protein ZapB
MKTNRTHAGWLMLLAFSTLNLQLSTAHAQGTAFTYQGRLNDGAGPATGLYDFRFAVYDDANAGGIQSTPVLVTLGVTNGLFTTTLNFGGNVFNGGARWLEINVRTNGAVDYATLAPRQPVTPAPYSIYAAAAGGVNAAAITGTLAPAQLPDGTLTNNAGGVTLSGSFIGSGGSLTGVNAATLNGTAAAGFWQLGGNNISAGQFLGSTNNQPVEIWAGGQRALRLEPTANDISHSNIVNVVGGSSVNFIAPGVYGSVIAGGGALNYYGQVGTNSVSANLSFLGGGYNNSIQTYSENSFLGGGWGNSIQTIADVSFLGGGENNSIQSEAYSSFLGGGSYNSIQTNAYRSFLGGGYGNSIQTYAVYSFLGGGQYNSIQTYAYNSFLGGGYGNSIQTNASFSFLGGGENNSIQPNASFSFLGGGYVNSIQTNAGASVLGGGEKNSIQTNASYSFLGGGSDNQVLANAPYSSLGGGAHNRVGGAGGTVPGGNGNGANGVNSFAAGTQAKANYDGSFVLADFQYVDFASTAPNQLSARFTGGVRFVTGGAGLTVDGNPVLTSGGGSGLTIQQNSDGAPNIIGGSSVNYIASGVEGSVIAGGGATNYLGIYGPETNSVSANSSFLGGGLDNSIQPYASYSFLGGGVGNSIEINSGYSFLGAGAGNFIQTNASFSFLGGGANNSIQLNADGSFLGGGWNNSIQPNASHSFLGGGEGNSIQTGAAFSVLGGGLFNTNGAPYSVVPGGDQNFAGGTNSFAAGHRAKANYAGDFVWADSQDADFNSTANNQFLIRAANGVGINKANPASALDVNGTVTATSFVGNGSGLTSLNAASLGASSINNNQLVNNSVTVSAGTGLSGGGAVALGGSVTLNNSGVLSVGASGPLASSGGQNPQITLTGIVSIANGGLGFAPGVLSSGQYIRSSGSGSWSVNSIQAGDLPSLSATYVDLSSGQTIGGTKNFSGSVGIGISPGYPLDVNGRMALRGSSSGVNAGLWLYDSAATSHTTRALLGMDGTGYFGVWGDMGANWGMVMNVTNGYVGIGTGTPDALLTVNGTADKPGGGSWNTFSDGRLKDVGAKFTHGLADLARIQPVHYHYKTDNPLNLPSQPEYVGVVAQQVQPAIPEAVQPNKDGYLTVNNDPIIWTMVNAIKELNQNLADGSQNSEVRIQKLETENAELKAHNEALSARLERIEKLLGQQLK